MTDLLDGPDDAATQYFKAKMSPELIEEMLPAIAESGLARYCDIFTEAHVFDLAASLLEQVQVGTNEGSGVVDLVRDAGGEFTEGSQTSGSQQSTPKSVDLAQVTKDDHDAHGVAFAVARDR